jgi:hypothetical protein
MTEIRLAGYKTLMFVIYTLSSKKLGCLVHTGLYSLVILQTRGKDYTIRVSNKVLYLGNIMQTSQILDLAEKPCLSHATQTFKLHQIKFYMIGQLDGSIRHMADQNLVKIQITIKIQILSFS